jgi:hypothetical protein
MEPSDHGLEALVKDEAPKQMLALTFEQQLGRILEGSSSLNEDDDYQDWLRWDNLDGFYKKFTNVNELTYLHYFKSVQMEGSWNIMKSKLKPINTKKI